MYRNIVVAVDGSEASKRALTEASRLARLAGARLTAVYVLDQAAAFTYAGACDPNLLTDGARELGRGYLDDARKAMQAFDVAGETELAETHGIGEDVATCLQGCVERRAADLVVMGTHGRRGVRRMVLGSVAERFVRLSHCPVLLVRDGADDTSAQAEGAHHAN